MNCEDAKRAIYLFVDGELPVEKAEALRKHLDVCEVCQREYSLAKREAEVLKEVMEEWVEEMPGREVRETRSAVPRALVLKVLALAAVALIFMVLTRQWHGPTNVLMVKRLGDEGWKEAGENVELGPGDSLVTGSGLRASFYLTPGTRLALREETEVRFDPERLLSIALVRGEVWVRAGEEDRVIVSLGGLSAEGAAAEFVVSEGEGNGELRAGLLPVAWAGESVGGTVFVLEGEVVVRTDEAEEVLGRGKRLAWRGDGLVTGDLSQEEASRLEWVEGIRNPYSGRVVGGRRHVVLNPFSVTPRKSAEEGGPR